MAYSDHRFLIKECLFSKDSVFKWQKKEDTVMEVQSSGTIRNTQETGTHTTHILVPMGPPIERVGPRRKRIDHNKYPGKIVIELPVIIFQEYMTI